MEKKPPAQRRQRVGKESRKVSRPTSPCPHGPHGAGLQGSPGRHNTGRLSDLTLGVTACSGLTVLNEPSTVVSYYYC